MTKLALISDIHYGARTDNPVLVDHLKKFFDVIFFPYLKKHKIKTVCILGDLVDKQKSINILTAKRMREDFLEKLEGMDVHVIAGNHDTYNKNTNEVNALDEILHGYPYHVYTSPHEVTIGDLKILFLPWICSDNEAESMQVAKRTKAQVCFAHLELKGIEMRKGSLSDIGEDYKRFSKFDVVATGHYHHRSSTDNIHYLGSPVQITWTDYADTKGFSVFDTKTRELEHVDNPYQLFHKINYDDCNLDTDEIDDDLLCNTYVKVVVKCREDVGKFDTFLRKLESLPVIDLQIVDNHLIQTNLEEHIDQAESTLDILSKSIETMDVKPEYRKDLNILLRDLYNEASLVNA